MTWWILEPCIWGAMGGSSAIVLVWTWCKEGALMQGQRLTHCSSSGVGTCRKSWGFWTSPKLKYVLEIISRWWFSIAMLNYQRVYLQVCWVIVSFGHVPSGFIMAMASWENPIFHGGFGGCCSMPWPWWNQRGPIIMGLCQDFMKGTLPRLPCGEALDHLDLSCTKDHRNRKRLCESCAAGTETFQGSCRRCQERDVELMPSGSRLIGSVIVT